MISRSDSVHGVLAGIVAGFCYRVSGPELPLGPLAWVGLSIWAAYVTNPSISPYWKVCSAVFTLLGVISRFAWLFQVFPSRGAVTAGLLVLCISLVAINVFAAYVLRKMTVRGCPMVLSLPFVICAGEIAAISIFAHTGLSLDTIMLPTTQCDTPIFQVADLGGRTLVSWGASAIAGILVSLWQRRPSINIMTQRIDRTVQAILILTLIYGFVRPFSLVTKPGPNVVLHSERWSERSLSAPGFSDIDIWPETALPVAAGDFDEVSISLSTKCTKSSRTLIIGCERLNAENACILNSAAIFLPGRDQPQFVDKRHLTPVTEYDMVVCGIWTIGSAEISLRPGMSSPTATLEHGRHVGIGICYDVCFPEWAKEAAKGTDFLIVLGGEGFTNSQSAHAQLLAVSRLRAVESRRSLVRSVDNGYSAIITPAGDVLECSRDFENIFGSVTTCDAFSCYHNFGAIPSMIVLAAAPAVYLFLQGKTK